MSRRLDAPCEIVREDGRKGVLGGAIGDRPFYCSSQNLIAVAGISADELGPTNSVPWDHASTGRSLTGTNLTLGLWEGDGAVVDQSRRVWQARRAGGPFADQSDPARWHATGVASTKGARATLQFTLTGQPRCLHSCRDQAMIRRNASRGAAGHGSCASTPAPPENHTRFSSVCWFFFECLRKARPVCPEPPVCKLNVPPASQPAPSDKGRDGRISATPASEPDERFSRIRLSSQWGLRKTNHKHMSRGPD